MERTVEWFVAITSLVVGASHVLLPTDWADAYRRLAGLGRAGALVNGGLSLAAGAAVVAGHPAWTWPGGVMTVFGWLMVVKGAVCFLAPEAALRSMERGARSPRGLVVGGAVLVALGAWAAYCVARGLASYHGERVNDTSRMEIYGFHPAGARAAFVDGSVKLLRESTPPAVLAAMATCAEEDEVDAATP